MPFYDVFNGLQHSCVFLFFFFFQAEDGIRDRDVTGVQTCALPISDLSVNSLETKDKASWVSKTIQPEQFDAELQQLLDRKSVV